MQMLIVTGGRELNSNSDSQIGCCGLVRGVNNMSRSHGRLLGRELGVLCREVAPKNDPSVETYIKRRKIEPRGRESERKSRRVVGYYEVVEEIPETIFRA